MVRTLPILLLFFVTRTCAQCGYAASLRTSKDYCLGSSLVIQTKHTLERIVWYKDGQPIDSALANQSLPKAPLRRQVPGVFPSSDIFADGNGYVYLIDGNRLRVVKWNPVTGLAAVVGEGLPTESTQGDSYIGDDRLFADNTGDVYVIDTYTRGIWHYSPGSTQATIIDPQTVDINKWGISGVAVAADCSGNVYEANERQSVIKKWAPGATSGQIVVGGNGTGPDQLINIFQMVLDSLGDIYVLGTNLLTKWQPGSTVGTVIGDWRSSGHTTPVDCWMDGKDTCYLASWQESDNDSFHIRKWWPGLAIPQSFLSMAWQTTARAPQVTVDARGDVFLMESTDSTIYEWPRTSSIDSAYTPNTTGVYYAIVTDMRGYAARTNPISINNPSNGTPSITISATATSTPVCTPITFTADPVNPGTDPSYQWMVSGVRVGDGSLTYSNNLFADSDQVYCIMMTQAGCAGPVTDTSNVIVLDIDPQGAASVKISTPKDSVCQGDSILFTAVVTNGSNAPSFEWLLNGAPTGNTGSSYGGNNFVTGDVVTCIITSDDVCGLAKSNSIPLTISTPPNVESGQVVTILHGHSQTLEPVITGDVDSWLWTPATGLSNPTIANPVATPDSNTLYTLTVGTPGGCTATGTILVNVYIPLSIPGAFTPNGDGHNDLFYVLGGPINSRIEDFAVFNRYGGEVFHAHNAVPGDRNNAWNGYLNGSPAPAGTYVYYVVMRFADGHTQLYKGTVILIR